MKKTILTTLLLTFILVAFAQNQDSVNAVQDLFQRTSDLSDQYRYALLQFTVRDSETNAVVLNAEVRNAGGFPLTYHLVAGVKYVLVRNDIIDDGHESSSSIITRLKICAGNYFTRNIEYPDPAVFSSCREKWNAGNTGHGSGKMYAVAVKATGKTFWVRYECPTTIYLRRIGNSPAPPNKTAGDEHSGNNSVYLNSNSTMPPNDSIMLAQAIALHAHTLQLMIKDSIMLAKVALIYDQGDGSDKLVWFALTTAVAAGGFLLGLFFKQSQKHSDLRVEVANLKGDTKVLPELKDNVKDMNDRVIKLEENTRGIPILTDNVINIDKQIVGIKADIGNIKDGINELKQNQKKG